MKKEDIETAAKKEAENLACLVYYGGSAISQEDIENAFVKGAEWRVNSAWHNTIEKPKNGAMIIALRSKYSPIVCGPFNFDWEETVEVFSLKKWAYVEDLLPNTEG